MSVQIDDSLRRAQSSLWGLDAKSKGALVLLLGWILLTAFRQTSLFFTQFVNGLMFGMILVMIALGLALILGLMGVMNFAHGALFMIGGYVSFTIIAQFDGPFFLALVLAPLAVGLLGLLMETVTLRPIYGTDPINTLLLTFGLTLMFEEATRFIWGASPLSYQTAPVLSSPVDLYVTTVPGISLFTVILGMLAVTAVYLLIIRTDFGLAIRAGVQDAEMAYLSGENLRLKFTILFVIGTMLAGLAGLLRGAETGIDPGMAGLFIILVFVVIVVGGMGSFFGSVVGGLLIGISMFIGPLLLSTAANLTGIAGLHPPGVQRVIPFIIMIIVLLIRPRGLFGEEGFLE